MNKLNKLSKKDNMRLIDALHYINYSVKEGLMSEETAEELMNLPWQETVERVSEIQDRADAYYDAVVKGEI